MLDFRLGPMSLFAAPEGRFIRLVRTLSSGLLERGEALQCLPLPWGSDVQGPQFGSLGEVKLETWRGALYSCPWLQQERCSAGLLGFCAEKGF